MVAKIGKFEDLARRGAAEALADVVDVRDDEDDEDRGFGDDQAGHADNAARGQHPRRLEFVASMANRCWSWRSSFVVASPDLRDV